MHACLKLADNVEDRRKTVSDRRKLFPCYAIRLAAFRTLQARGCLLGGQPLGIEPVGLLRELAGLLFRDIARLSVGLRLRQRRLLLSDLFSQPLAFDSGVLLGGLTSAALFDADRIGALTRGGDIGLSLAFLIRARALLPTKLTCLLLPLASPKLGLALPSFLSPRRYPRIVLLGSGLQLGRPPLGRLDVPPTAISLLGTLRLETLRRAARSRLAGRWVGWLGRLG